MKIEIDETKKKHLGSLNLNVLKMLNKLEEDKIKNHPESDAYQRMKEMEKTVMQKKEHSAPVFEEKLQFKPINLNFLKLNIDQVKKLPTDELLKLLSGESHKGAIHDSIVQLISNEILRREIKEASKPHWTVTPTFIVGCIASVLAAISILVTIYFSVFYKAENNNKHTSQSYTIGKNSNPK